MRSNIVRNWMRAEGVGFLWVSARTEEPLGWGHDEYRFVRVLVWIGAGLVIWSVDKMVLNGCDTWYGIAGMLVLGWQVGKWLRPHFFRLDTDRYPQGREFEVTTRLDTDRYPQGLEVTTPSLSSAAAASRVGYAVAYLDGRVPRKIRRAGL